MTARRKLAESVRHSAESLDRSSEQYELLLVLARIVDGKETLRAFGAPGDWGYQTHIGMNLVSALREKQDKGFDLIAHLERQRKFSEKTFGPGPRAEGVVDHIRKELREIELNPIDLIEWIDVVLLALDGAWRAGYTPEQIAEAINAKMTRNEQRIWPDWRTAPQGKAIEHDRSAEAG